MSFEGVLRERRRAVLDDWTRRILDSYPDVVRRTFRTSSDRFRNPMAGALAEGAEAVFDALLDDADADELGMCLDKPVRLRAVQRFKASEAVAFVLDLKTSVRSVLGRAVERDPKGWEAFRQRIDAAALVAFDTYVDCREKALRLHAEAERKMTRRMIERAGLDPDAR